MSAVSMEAIDGLRSYSCTDAMLYRLCMKNTVYKTVKLLSKLSDDRFWLDTLPKIAVISSWLPTL